VLFYSLKASSKSRPGQLLMFLIDELLLASNSYFGRNMHKNALFLMKNCKKSPRAVI